VEVDMQVDQLSAALAVAEEMSFRQAAARLHLSQPALSERVARLEAELGTRLFDRGRDGTRLTEEGKQLLPLVETAVRSVRDVAASARQAGVRRTRSQFRVGILVDGVDMLTWPIIRAASEAWPEQDVVLVPLVLREAVTSVVERRVDAALCRGPYGDPRLTTTTIAWCPAGAAMSPRHPLADALAVDPDDLLAHASMLAPDGVDPTMAQWWFPAPNQRGHRMDSDDLTAFVRLAEWKGSAGYFPVGMAAGLSQVGLTFRPLTTPRWAPLQVLTGTRDPAAALFRDLAVRTAAALLPLQPGLAAMPPAA
jgi:DNA-binding transcriptional LysR family regulator